MIVKFSSSSSNSAAVQRQREEAVGQKARRERHGDAHKEDLPAGEDEIAQYLEGTAYAKGAQALRESASAFERWCDNRMIEMLKPQKYEAFSVGPLLGYLIARETEIKTVRIILTGKQNGFSDEAIRERIREMYV